MKYLNNFDPKGNIVGPASQSLLGDCYVNLKQLDKAVAAFDKAISLSGDNADYVGVRLNVLGCAYMEVSPANLQPIR